MTACLLSHKSGVSQVLISSEEVVLFDQRSWFIIIIYNNYFYVPNSQ